MQNKAKPGATGVYGQRFSCWPWAGRGVKRAKRSRFGPVGGYLRRTNPIWGPQAPPSRIADWKMPSSIERWRQNAPNEPNLARPAGKMRRTNPILPLPGRGTRGKCAEQSQFGAPRRQMGATDPALVTGGRGRAHAAAVVRLSQPFPTVSVYRRRRAGTGTPDATYRAGEPTVALRRESRPAPNAARWLPAKLTRPRQDDYANKMPLASQR
jgi:hypothetical protein